MTGKNVKIIVTVAIVAVALIGLGALATEGFTGGDGEQTRFGGMFRSAGFGNWGGGPVNAGGKSDSPDAEDNAPVTGPGAQNGLFGGSLGAKNGTPGSADTSGGSGGGADASADSPGERAAGTDRNNSGGAGGGGGNTGGGSGTGVPTGPAVTLTIDAEKYRPGYTIMSTRTVSFTEGETVFDILYRECRASKIHMASRWTPGYNSYYVEAIDNLYEFSAGELSGWMYSVNDWFPNYGSSSYKLEDGDVIAWRFTMDLGRDIGGGTAVGG